VHPAAAQHVEHLDGRGARAEVDHGDRPVAPHGGRPAGRRRPGGDPAQRRRDQDGDEQDHAHGPQVAAAVCDGAGGEPGHGDVAQVDVAEGQRGAQGGDALQRQQPDRRRQVEQAGERAADDAGHETGGDAPHHQRAGQRGGRDVGGQRGEGHGTERGDQDRRHGQLRADGHAQRLPRPPGAGQPGDDGRREEQHPGAGCDAEAEPHRAREEGVDDQQPAHRDREVPPPAGGPAGGGGPQGDRGDERRSDDRRLEPGEEREPGDRRRRHHEPRPEPQPAQQRTGHRQDEEDVRARHGKQVREARGPEVGGELGGLGTVVAEREPGQQRPVAVGQRRRTAVERASHPVGGRCVRRSPAHRGDRLDAQPAGQVPGDRPVLPALERLHLAPDDDALARQGRPQRGDGRRRARLGQQASTVEPDVDAHPSRRRRLGIGHQHHSGVDPAGVARVEAGQGARCQARREDTERQGGQQDHRPARARRPSEPGERDHGGTDRHGHGDRMCHLGADPGRRRQNRHGQVVPPLDGRPGRARIRHGRGPAGQPAWPRRCPAPPTGPPRWRTGRVAPGGR